MCIINGVIKFTTCFSLLCKITEICLLLNVKLLTDLLDYEFLFVGLSTIRLSGLTLIQD